MKQATNGDKTHDDILTAALATVKLEETFLTSDKGRVHAIAMAAFTFTNAIGGRMVAGRLGV